jgi:hypothetical protein
MYIFGSMKKKKKENPAESQKPYGQMICHIYHLHLQIAVWQEGQP